MSHHHYLKNLATKNHLFFIALHFCPAEYRSKIAALIGLYTDWTQLNKRISEPIAIQMRLAWWREQFENPVTGANLPPEIALLKAYKITDLINAIENEYVFCEKSDLYQSAVILYTLIADILNVSDVSNIKEYGRYYGFLHNPHNNLVVKIPKLKLCYRLRFLRIPIILHEKTNFFSRLYALVKNFIV